MSHKEPLAYECEFDGDAKYLLPDNSEIVRIRKQPHEDYLHYWEPVDDENEAHWFSFGPKEFLLWMGGVALNEVEVETIAEANENNGDFYELHHWRPDVAVHDDPTPMEEEFFNKHVANISGHIEEEWQNLLEDDDGQFHT